MSPLRRTTSMIHLALALTVVATPAQQSAPPARAPFTADELLARHLDARGGARRFSEVTSIQRTSRVADMTLAAAWVRPDKYRLESHDPESGRYDLRTAVGTTGWSGDLRTSRIFTDDIQALREDVAWGWEVFMVNDLGMRVALAPPPNGRPWQGLRLIFRSGREVTVWIDTTTWLEAARSREVVSPDGVAAPMSMPIGRAATVGGLVFPAKIGIADFSFAVDGPVPNEWFKVSAADR